MDLFNPLRSLGHFRDFILMSHHRHTSTSILPAVNLRLRASSSAVLMNLSLRFSDGVHIWDVKILGQCADHTSPRSVADPELFPDPDSHLHHGLELPQFRF